MGMFEMFNGKKKKEENLELDKEVERINKENTERKKLEDIEARYPREGENNRFRNNLEFSDRINQEALNFLKNRALPVLEKLEADPRLFNFHDQNAGSEWAGQFLAGTVFRKLDAIYGTDQLEYMSPEETAKLSPEVLSIYKRIQAFKNKIRENPKLINPM